MLDWEEQYLDFSAFRQLSIRRQQGSAESLSQGQGVAVGD